MRPSLNLISLLVVAQSLLLLSLLLMSTPLVQGENVIKVCSSTELKRLQADLCSNLYKRGRHSKITFNSYGYHHRRVKRSSGSHIDNLPEACCLHGCPRSVYANLPCD